MCLHALRAEAQSLTCYGNPLTRKISLATACSAVCLLAAHLNNITWRRVQHSAWLISCWCCRPLSSEQLLYSFLLGSESLITAHFLMSVLAFHISESWKDFYYKAETAESLPIRADMMLISPVLLGKLFSTFVPPIINAKELWLFLWVLGVSGSRTAMKSDWVRTNLMQGMFLFGSLCLYSSWTHSKMLFVN